MKRLTEILLIASILCLAGSCNDDPSVPELPGDPGPPSYYLSNQSGHTVSVVHKPSCREMPDSLVLLNGEEFRLHTGYSYMVLYMDALSFDTELIYYDGRYVLSLRDLPNDRFFSYTWIYQRKPESWDYVFTLTAEDYAYAVENGTDLGERLE